MQKICTALSSRAEGPSGGVGPSPCPGKMKPTPQQAHSQPQHAAAAATAAVAPSRHTRTRRGAQPNPPTNMTYHIFCAYLATGRHASPARTHGDTAEFHALWSVWAEWNGPTARDRQQDNNTRVSLVNGSILGQGNNYVLGEAPAHETEPFSAAKKTLSLWSRGSDGSMGATAAWIRVPPALFRLIPPPFLLGPASHWSA